MTRPTPVCARFMAAYLIEAPVGPLAVFARAPEPPLCIGSRCSDAVMYTRVNPDARGDSRLMLCAQNTLGTPWADPAEVGTDD